MKSLPLLFVSVRLHQARLFCARQNRSFLTQRVALVATILCLASSGAPALAQTTPAAINPAASTAPSAGSGRISGRVLNPANGQYLENAQVTVKETNQTVYSERDGVYNLVAVPSGPVTLEVFYTGLDVANIPVTVPPGGTIVQDVELTSVKRYGKAGDTVKLDKFAVNADRETNAQSIAINERRFAPNIKSVVSTDTLGAVLGNSVGEFLKNVSGIAVEYGTMDVNTISLRGLGDNKTAIMMDGVAIASNYVTTSRAFDVKNLTLNEISRIEVTKSPTPAMPADSIGGIVNFVGKSAFERKGRVFKFGLNLATTSEELNAGRSASPFGDKYKSTLRPSANFDLTLPISKTFGLVITGAGGDTMGKQHLFENVWQTSGSGTNASNASIENPFVRTITYFDGRRYMTRNSLRVQADWKLGTYSKLSVSQARNAAITQIGTQIMVFDTGTNGTPTVAGGPALTWDPTFTRGATGRGSVSKTGRNQSIEQYADNTKVYYVYDDGLWKAEGRFGRSSSSSKRRYADIGSFMDAIAVNNRPIRVNLLGVVPGVGVSTIEVIDNDGQEFNWRTLDDFRPSTAIDMRQISLSKTYTGSFDLRRQITNFSFPMSVQLGGSVRRQIMDARPNNSVTTFNGPDGKSPNVSAAPYKFSVYKNEGPHYGFSDLVWISPYATYAAAQSNPLLYAQTPAQVVSAESFRIVNSEYIQEDVHAAYLQGEIKLLSNRLKILGGVRFEKTKDRGIGALTDSSAVWTRNAAGGYVLDSAGKPIRKPEAGAVGSLDELHLITKERASISNKSYDGLYPSLHVTFSAKDNLLIRGSYARTYSRPDFSDVIPRTVATVADVTSSNLLGTLTVRNPSLTPWTADNFDFSVEYYTKQGGLFSAGLFAKNIQDFFGSSSKIASPELLNQLGLDQQYVGWAVNTKFNAGTARVSGAEFEIRQSLSSLGGWGKHFTVFTNATKVNLSGSSGADFSSFVKTTGNFGLTFATRRLEITPRISYRGNNRRNRVAALGRDGYVYFKPLTTLDISASYQLSRRLSFILSIVNVNNTPQRQAQYGAATPAYAKYTRSFDFGAQISAGITGTF